MFEVCTVTVSYKRVFSLLRRRRSLGRYRIDFSSRRGLDSRCF